MPIDERISVDFDHHSLEWLARRHEHNAELRATCPVVWNPRYGGFWFVTGYEEVATVARDSVTFTPRYPVKRIEGDDLNYIGIMGVPRPKGMPRIGIAEAEPNRHAALRRLLNPFMLPPAVAAFRPFVEQTATWFLDQKIAEGAMDLVLDFTNPVPAILTMKMIGLPCTSWQHYAEFFHATVAYGTTSPEYQHAMSIMPDIVGELIDVAEHRRKKPEDDILSKLVTLEVDGERLDNDELIAVLWNLIGGGVDTTTSLTSLALHHLEAHPDLRQRLIEHPELLVPACEEYLRWTSVNETLTVTCTKDTVLGGQRITRGDVVMMSWLGANFDPAVFDQPEELLIDRNPNPHLAFGVGAYRCPGLHVARALFMVMMQEVLSRMGDYVVDQENTRFYQGNPELFGMVRMPVRFTPGQPVGVARPF